MRLIVELRFGDVPQVDAVRLARENGDGFHEAAVSQYGKRAMRVRTIPVERKIIIDDERSSQARARERTGRQRRISRRSCKDHLFGFVDTVLRNDQA
jgi:hypothetical protein